jgi:hypothetical protein
MIKNILTTILLVFGGHVLADNLFTAVSLTEVAQLEDTAQAGLVADVNVNLLKSRASQVEIDLPDGQQITAVFNNLRQNQLSGFSWQGHVSGDDAQIVTLSIYEDAIAGSIHTHDTVYEIQPLGDNRIKLLKLNPEVFPECDGGEPVPHSMSGGQRPLNNITNNRATNTVDVIVVYTPEARVGGGGHNGIKATAQAAVDAMNSSLVNSQVDTEIVLLYAGEVNYNDTNDSSADLDWIRNSTEVENLKNQYGADMAGLLVNSMGGCGRGYVMRNPGPGFKDYAVQVTKRSCAVGNLSFAHEFGHNMGLEHNPENSSATSTTASYPWSFGHYHSGQYRTVMSYSNPCTGIQQNNFGIHLTINQRTVHGIHGGLRSGFNTIMTASTNSGFRSINHNHINRVSGTVIGYIVQWSLTS